MQMSFSPALAKSVESGAEKVKFSLTSQLLSFILIILIQGAFQGDTFMAH